jgi:hypothetical protein
MRRKVIAITALVCLVVAGSAFAATAFNHYGASFKFSGPAGSKKKPAAVSYTLTYSAASTTSGNRAWPLTDIKSTLDGVKSNWKSFPKCTEAQMDNLPKYNAVCPKNSLVATGPVQSYVGPGSDMAVGAPGSWACSLKLWVYNSGGGKLTYFFTVPNPAKCNGLTTGAAQPYVATTKEVHGNLFQDVPLPPDVSTNVEHLGLYGSLEHEVLNFKKLTIKVKGKTVPFIASTGCTKNKHKWSVTFAGNNGSTTQTQTINGAAKC